MNLYNRLIPHLIGSFRSSRSATRAPLELIELPEVHLDWLLELLGLKYLCGRDPVVRCAWAGKAGEERIDRKVAGDNRKGMKL